MRCACGSATKRRGAVVSSTNAATSRCVCERLTRHGRIEAKRLAEDLAEDVFGVRDVTNQIKVSRAETQAVGTAGAARDPGGRAIEGLAGTANTPEITPPDRGEPKKA